MWPRAQVSANHGVAAGRDVNARDIIVKYGLTEEEVRALVHELHEQDRPTVEKLIELAQKLGVTQSAVANFFRILGQRQIPDERLLEALAEVAERHVALTERLRTLSNDDPAVIELRAEAAAAIEAGDYDRADALLDEAEAVDERAIHEQEQALDRRRLSAAETLAQRGELERARLNYRRAAEHFAAAAARVPASASERRWSYLLRQGDVLYDLGNEFGDNAALSEAIAIYGAALRERPRNVAPLQWAATQNNLGAALRTLGARESGTARLEQAVEAYRAALEERTRARAPLDWAMTQNNLGTALLRLGERAGRSDLLEEALGAVEGAFEVYAAAGFRHYEADFHDRIQALRAAIEQAKRTG